MHARATLVLLLAASLMACTKDPVTPLPTDDTGEDAGTPNISVNVTSVDFGVSEDIGHSTRGQLVVTNTGTAPLHITDFAVDEPFSTGTTVLTLAPNGSQTISLSYKPTEYSAAQATLLIQSDDPDTPDVGIALTGEVELDADGDGYTREEAGGDDCDDSTASTHPGAADAPYDGVDSDCAGDSDYDQDKDGYIADAYGGLDCNDAVPTINPDVEDIWYDGVDSDCDGSNDYDQDGDGYTITSTTRKDCDDLDPEAYPDAAEVLDGKKNDCNGVTDHDISVLGAEDTVLGEADGDGFGSGLETGDFDGDGTYDLLVGAGSYNSGDGNIFLWLGSSGMPTAGDTLSTSDTDFGGSGTESLGYQLMSLGDAGGGGNDIGIGAPTYNYSNNMYEGRIYVMDAADLADGGDTSDAHTVIDGYSDYYYGSDNMTEVGQAFNSVDFNGDGVQDFVFFSNANSYYSYYAEDQFSIYYGASGGLGTVAAESADASYKTESESSYVGDAFSPGGDVDGDGIEDFIIGGKEVSTSYSYDGAAWLIWGNSSEYSTSSTPDAADSFIDYWAGDESSDYVGTMATLIPDLDGDGMAEVAYFNGNDGELGITWGRSSLKGAGAMSFDDDSDLIVQLGSSLVPTSIRHTKDMSGDGNPEVVMVMNGSGSDQAYIFDLVAAGTGNLDTSDSLVSFKNTASDHGTNDWGQGFAMHPADLDGDGYVDFVVGDPGYEYDLDADGTAEENVGGLFFWYLD